MAWGYIQALCNVYWLDLPSLNIEGLQGCSRDHNRRAAKGRHGNGRLFFVFWSLNLLFLFYFFFRIKKLGPSSLLLLLIWSFQILTISLSLPNRQATLHCLCTHLRLTAIRGDAAIKDEPGAVNQPLVAPLSVIELDRSPDTSMSDEEANRV